MSEPLQMQAVEGYRFGLGGRLALNSSCGAPFAAGLRGHRRSRR